MNTNDLLNQLASQGILPTQAHERLMRRNEERKKVRETQNIFGARNQEYLSLSALAKGQNEDAPAETIHRWLRNRNTQIFLMLWKEEHNPLFLRPSTVKNMTPKRWISETHAAGIRCRQG